MNRWLKSGAVSVSIASSVLALNMLACGGSVAAEGPAVTADGVGTKAPVAGASVMRGHAKLAVDALGEVPLRDDQRAQIEKLAVTASASEAAVHAAHQALVAALADQISAGQIDKTALQPKIDAIATAALSSQAVERSGLEQLHAILDTSQRSLFVDALQAKVQARWQEHAGHHGAMGGMKARWADLNLTDDQEAQIKTIMHDEFGSHHGEWKGGLDRGEKTLEAFKGEVFSIDQVAPAMDVRAKTSEMAGRFIDVATRVLPILTAEQRATAAQKLHARAATPATPETEDNAGDPLRF